MSEHIFSGLWRRLLERPNDDPVKTIAVALIVALIASVVVSTAAVVFEPGITANLDAQRRQKIETMLANLPGLESIVLESGADSLETRVVDLTTASFTTAIDANSINGAISKIELTPEIDVAGIKQRNNFVSVKILYKGDDLQLLILPIYGKGYQSTIHANLALSGDLNTVMAMSITEQGETPGLGARITDPDWQAQWTDKQLRDDEGTLRLKIIKGKAQGLHEIDGITGATRTGDGINKTLEFWLGEYGYAPFLARIRNGEAGL